MGNNYFGDPAMNLMALGFEVTQDITLSQNTTVSSEITVRSGATISVPLDGIIYFENNGKITNSKKMTLMK